MEAGQPRLFSNARGIWREDTPGRRFGIEWHEIVRVTGYRLDGITRIDTVIELDFEFGESLELHADWPGFAEVASALTARLAGIAPEWQATIEARTPQEAPVAVWCRN